MALILGIHEYGLTAILYTIALLYCMFMPILIALEIYLTKRARNHIWKQSRISYFIITGALAIFLFLFLPDRLQTMVIIFVPLLLIFLLIIDLLRSLLRH